MRRQEKKTQVSRDVTYFLQCSIEIAKAIFFLVGDLQPSELRFSPSRSSWQCHKAANDRHPWRKESVGGRAKEGELDSTKQTG